MATALIDTCTQNNYWDKNFGKRQKFALLTEGLPTVARESDLFVFVERVPEAIKCDTGNK